MTGYRHDTGTQPAVRQRPQARPPRLLPTVVLSVAAALALYVVLWTGRSQKWLGPKTADESVLEWFWHTAADREWWIPLWDDLSTVFTPGLWRILIVVPVVVELYRHRIRVAAFLIVGVWGSGLVTNAAKALADLDRPVMRMVEASGSSFPSGHALGVLVTVGALLVVYRPCAGHASTPAVGGREASSGIVSVGLVIVGVVITVSIGVARIALNVHYPSDVLAGWALGYAWLMLCLWMVSPHAEDYRGQNTCSTR